MGHCNPASRGVSGALGSVVLGHIVGHPVDLGSPALSQGLIKLLSELLQRLFIRFTQSQRILRRRGIWVRRGRRRRG